MPHLLLYKGLDLVRLLSPNGKQVCTESECLQPFIDPKNKCEDGADDDEPAVDFQRGAGGGD